MFDLLHVLTIIVGGDGGNDGGDVPPIGESDGNKPVGPSNSPKTGLALLLSNMLETYSRLLQEHPYPTKIISSGLVGGAGDVLIQQFQRRNNKDKPFDFRRLIVFSSVAALYIAPTINVWFNWLNSIPLPTGYSNIAKALVQMAIDQTVGATVITVGFFYAFELADRCFPPYAKDGKLLEFLDAGFKSTKNNLWLTLVANWYCWPIINFVNFLYVPLEYRYDLLSISLR